MLCLAHLYTYDIIFKLWRAHKFIKQEVKLSTVISEGYENALQYILYAINLWTGNTASYYGLNQSV